MAFLAPGVLTAERSLSYFFGLLCDSTLSLQVGPTDHGVQCQWLLARVVTDTTSCGDSLTEEQAVGDFFLWRRRQRRRRT